MRNIRFVLFLVLALFLASCEFLESPDDTASVSEGFITYPAISLEGEQFISIPVGGTYEDPGAPASLGVDDISSDIVQSGTIDASNPGVYPLGYSVSIINTLDEQATVSAVRYVAVYSDSVKDSDFSGTWSGDGTAISGAWNQAATVSPISGVWYNIDKALASGNNLGVFFAVVGSIGAETPGKVVVPTPSSPFGTVNTTNPGTSSELTDNGFQWTLYISCCGNFGPIIYSR